LDGRSTELVRDGSGAWRLKNDDGSRIQRVGGLPGTSGQKEDSYWVLTDRDGTRFWFGVDTIGEAAGTVNGAVDSTALNSQWRVPVFGNHSGEPCHGASFAGSWCDLTWRWNLAYVEDVHGHSMSYHYEVETNRYGRNLNTAVSAYDRGGYLREVRYGARDGENHTAKVVFTTAGRCADALGVITGADCGQPRSTDRLERWPDVPVDMLCSSTTSCVGKMSPSFFTTRRLAGVETQVLHGGSWSTVDSWALGHTFPESGDSVLGPALWLSEVTHTGRRSADSTTAVTLPGVRLRGVQLPNRVDTSTDGFPAIYRYRLASIETETGGLIDVQYKGNPQTPGHATDAAYCDPGETRADPTLNTERCFPVSWSAYGETPVTHWFHAYVVSTVDVMDRSGVWEQSRTERTTYRYPSPPTWVRDDSALVPEKYRTVNEFRGFAQVEVVTGDPDALPAGELLKTGYLYDVGTGGGATDEHLTGFLRRETTYLGDTTTRLAETTWDPVTRQTGSRAATVDLEAATSAFVDVASETTITLDPASGAEVDRATTATSYDGLMRPEWVSETASDTTVAGGHATCTATRYVDNPDLWLYSLPRETRTWAGACGTSPSWTGMGDRASVGGERVTYDGGGTPTLGLATRVETLAGTTTGPFYAEETVTAYDSHGRPTSVTDPVGATTTTTYTPSAGGPVTAVEIRNPLGHIQRSELDPFRGGPRVSTGANGERTEYVYDALGRVTRVWGPDRARASFADSPSAEFAYRVQASATTAADPVRRVDVSVTTSTPRYDGARVVSVEHLDAQLRTKQVQATAPCTASVSCEGDLRCPAPGLMEAAVPPWR
jgi:YD repeat-containing protein